MAKATKNTHVVIKKNKVLYSCTIEVIMCVLPNTYLFVFPRVLLGTSFFFYIYIYSFLNH